MNVKHTIALSAVLVILLSGCGNDQYAIERHYWLAQKQAEKIFKNPDATPANQLEKAVAAFAGFVKKFPENSLALDADFSISRLYVVKLEYDKARTQLRSILTKYPESEALAAEVTFAIGNSYEKQGKWDSALVQYRKILQEYPATYRGLDVPLYIAQYYKVKYEPDRMIAALQSAISHYKGLSAKYPDSPFGLKVSTLIAECFVGLNDWQGVVNTYEDLIAKYKHRASMEQVLLSEAVIYHRELKDNAKAKATLQRIIDEYPKSGAVKTAEQLLKELDKRD